MNMQTLSDVLDIRTMEMKEAIQVCLLFSFIYHSSVQREPEAHTTQKQYLCSTHNNKILHINMAIKLSNNLYRFILHTLLYKSVCQVSGRIGIPCIQRPSTFFPLLNLAGMSYFTGTWEKNSRARGQQHKNVFFESIHAKQLWWLALLAEQLQITSISVG